MLLNFSVANYKSFKRTQELDLVTTVNEKHSDNTFTARNSNLLKSVAIYGANASGKSNLLNALGFMQSFILTSANNQSGDVIYVSPFKLDAATLKKTSKFKTDLL